ncbi:Transcriptional regulator, TetR family [Serinicoccus hydrothermalis]|uniref:Transcriptional regulator, TetR family n=1 Tax=Serinicoccus hydrothermalis TaxID=1758689 RepID=A0A1B1N9L5_9MICO|nr:TetR/AcrR family transcriptional regulator [Serinicoccus hydrothermalis]ANS78116.1 Transcriptional regulator, TetR family [Serinicoccus hydrothermalis]
MAKEQTRTRILDAAESLFFTEGIAVTGVDRVASQAGVSVVTLYAHMGSKDGLLAQVLRRRLDDWQSVWQERVDAAPGPQERVLAVFDALTAYRDRSSPSQWCSFLATASERPATPGEEADPAVDLVAADTAGLVTRLRELAAEADPERVEEIVDTVLLVYNGVLASLLRGAPQDPARVGAEVARSALGWGRPV